MLTLTDSTRLVLAYQLEAAVHEATRIGARMVIDVLPGRPDPTWQVLATDPKRKQEHEALIADAIEHAFVPAPPVAVIVAPVVTSPEIPGDGVPTNGEQGQTVPTMEGQG